MSNLYFNTARSVFRYDPSLEGHVWYNSGGSIAFRFGEQVIPASLQTGNEPEFHIDKVQFGDTYEQVTESGINAVRSVFSVGFDKKRREVAYAIKRFLEGEPEGSIYNRRVSEWFWWLPPFPFFGLDITDPMKVRCEKYKMVPVDYNAWTITADFIQSFEP